MGNRRTKAEIEALKGGLFEIVQEFEPMTVRQVFYQAVSRGLVAKSEAEYKQTVIRLLTNMRKDGAMPPRWIADNSRWMRKPRTYGNLQSMLDESIDLYRRALWRDQDEYVEIWLEKEALSGVLLPITARWDVPLMITRGYPSFTFLHEAGQSIREEIRAGKHVSLYYFGDNDPSGVDIPRHVEAELRGQIGPAINDRMTFERVAVNPDQIVDLQTRPTKKTDSRARWFEGESVEVDAIHPDTLRQMAEQRITQHIDDSVYQGTLKIEDQERETLRQMTESAGLEP